MAKIINLNGDFYPVPSFVKGSMLGKDDPVMVGEFWAPEIYEYISDARMTEAMRRQFFSDLIRASLEERYKNKEDQDDSSWNRD